MLWNYTSWIRLNLIVQIQVFRHPCGSFLIDSQITASSVGKDCFVALNVKLQVKNIFKTFHWLWELLYTAFTLNTTNSTACFARKFCTSYQQVHNLRTGTVSLQPCILNAKIELFFLVFKGPIIWENWFTSRPYQKIWSFFHLTR